MERNTNTLENMLNKNQMEQLFDIIYSISTKTIKDNETEKSEIRINHFVDSLCTFRDNMNIEDLLNQKLDCIMGFPKGSDLREALVYLDIKFLKDIPFTICDMEKYLCPLAMPFTVRVSSESTIKDLFDKLLNIYDGYKMLVYKDKIEIVKVNANKIQFID